MRREGPELTDDDLRRLVHLGGAVDQIAEAAGIEAGQVRRRLEPADAVVASPSMIIGAGARALAWLASGGRDEVGPLGQGDPDAFSAARGRRAG